MFRKIIIVVFVLTAIQSSIQPSGAGEGAIKSITLPIIEIVLKEGEGRETAATYCSICHSADYITMQPAFPADKWSAIVHKMIVVFGAPVNEDDSRTIINYLSKNYGHTFISAEDIKSPGEVKQQGPTGEELFLQNCSVCHRGGGNILNPEKTLRKEDLDEYGIKSPEDIIRIMRNPGPGMRAFDRAYIPDKDAEKIAEYILKTF